MPIDGVQISELPPPPPTSVVMPKEQPAIPTPVLEQRQPTAPTVAETGGGQIEGPSITSPESASAPTESPGDIAKDLADVHELVSADPSVNAEDVPGAVMGALATSEPAPLPSPDTPVTPEAVSSPQTVEGATSTPDTTAASLQEESSQQEADTPPRTIEEATKRETPIKQEYDKAWKARKEAEEALNAPLDPNLTEEQKSDEMRARRDRYDIANYEFQRWDQIRSAELFKAYAKIAAENRTVPQSNEEAQQILDQLPDTMKLANTPLAERLKDIPAAAFLGFIMDAVKQHMDNKEALENATLPATPEEIAQYMQQAQENPLLKSLLMAILKRCLVFLLRKVASSLGIDLEEQAAIESTLLTPPSAPSAEGSLPPTSTPAAPTTSPAPVAKAA